MPSRFISLLVLTSFKDAAVYPNICIYPSVNTIEDSVIESQSDSVAFKPVVVGLPVSQDYPIIDICECLTQVRGAIDTHLSTDPAAYPYNLESIYPVCLAELSGTRHAVEDATRGASELKEVSVTLEAAYPTVEPCASIQQSCG